MRGVKTPAFVLVSDFANFVLYDLESEEQLNLPLFAGRPISRVEFPLADLPRHIRSFAFMLGQNGGITNLVNVTGGFTGSGLVVVSPFNNLNQNGTSGSSVFPANATHDSLYGNTEAYNGLSNVKPVVRLTGLSSMQVYSFTFYASRTGVTDNRETQYSVVGVNSNSAVLNVANNVNNVAVISGIMPDSSGNITISLFPTANNNNAYHFIYLRVLRVDAMPVLANFTAPVFNGSQRIINWSGVGQLQWAPVISGPWTPIIPAAISPYTETSTDAQRFYRLQVDY